MKLRFLALALLAFAGCQNQLANSILQHLDRPVDIAFGCVLGITNEDQTQGTVAMPTSLCGSHGNVIPGVGSLDAGTATTQPTNIGLVLESVRGDVSIANLDLSGVFLDSDPFALGLNGLPVGRLPVGIVTSSDGCYAAVANSGSCDLSTVDIAKAFRSKPDAVRRVAIRNQSGILQARPAAIAAPPQRAAGTTLIDEHRCDTVGGVVFVAFPSCHLVARVDVSSGTILDGIRFNDNAAPELVGPDVTCPVEPECEGGSEDAGVPPAPDAGTEVLPDAGTAAPGSGPALEPRAVTIEPDGSRLYIGGLNSPSVTFVELDAAYKAESTVVVPLESPTGVRKISASGVIIFDNPQKTQFRFLYMIMGDSSIHVINASRSIPTPVECDTQIDRRFLHATNNPVLLGCFPNRQSGFPRRADANGPGIRLPDTIIPTDIAFFTNPRLAGDIPVITASQFGGTFAAVSAIGPLVDPTFGRGLAYFIDINDAWYADLTTGTANDLGDTQRVDTSGLAAHSLRDSNPNRYVSSSPCLGSGFTDEQGPIRTSGSPARTSTYVYNDELVPADAGLAGSYAPSLHRAACLNSAGNPTFSDWELGQGAPPDVRAALVPDLGRSGIRTSFVGGTADEQIIVTWEGPLTANLGDSHKSGARVTIDQGGLSLDTPGALLCNLGVQRGDVGQLIGCITDFDCGPDEVCVNHPDAPSTVTGMCLLQAKRDELLTACENLLTTLRSYTVIEPGDDHTIVVPRPATLYASPVDGCVSDDQCEQIEQAVLTAAGSTLAPHRYRCESDPAGGGVPQCVVACGLPDDISCDAGSTCDTSTETCNLGPVSQDIDPRCLQPLQMYEYHAGSAFTVVSSQNEYKSRQMVDPQTGLCVEDTSLSPLVVQRFHRLETPCTDLSITAVGPNPCSLTLSEPATDPTTLKTSLRTSYGIRIRSSGITFDVTDVAVPFPGIDSVRFSPIFDDYTMSFNIAAGFFPYSVNLFAPLPERMRIAPDGTMYIVDSGDNAAIFSAGQVVPLLTNGLVSPNVLK